MNETATETARPRLKRFPKAYGGSYQGIVDRKGIAHRYLNAAIPDTPAGTLLEAICDVCGHAYAHLIGARTTRWSECRSDAWAIWIIAWQHEGAPRSISDSLEYTGAYGDPDIERAQRETRLRNLGLGLYNLQAVKQPG